MTTRKAVLSPKSNHYQYIALETPSVQRKTRVNASSRRLEKQNINLSDEQTNADPMKMKFLACLMINLPVLPGILFFLEVFFLLLLGFSISEVWMMTYLGNNCFHSILPGSLEILRKQWYPSALQKHQPHHQQYSKKMESAEGSLNSLNGRSSSRNTGHTIIIQFSYAVPLLKMQMQPQKTFQK